MDGYNVCAVARECAIVYVRAIERNVNSPRCQVDKGRAGDKGTRGAATLRFLLARRLARSRRVCHVPFSALRARWTPE